MRIATLLIGLLLAASATGESLWVDDRMRLSLYAEPDSNSERLELLESGDELEALGEYSVGYEYVRSPDGNEGWVNDAFVVDSAPARVRITAVEEERDEVRAQLAEREAELEELRETLSEHQARLAGSVDLWHATAVDPLTRTEVARDRAAQEGPRVRVHFDLDMWSMAALAVAGLLLLGLAVAAGWNLRERQLRRKMGGFRL